MSAEVAANSSSNIIKVSEIGMAFGREYYTVLSREPSRLHLFYAKNSTLLHADEGDLDTPIVIGSDAIQSAVNKNSFLGARFIIGSIDCHPSQNGGILVNVLGQIQKRGQASSSRHFMQTFFLAEQPSGYFILNENLRFLERPTVAADVSPVAAAVSVNEIAPVAAPVVATPVAVAQVEVTPVPTSAPVTQVAQVESVVEAVAAPAEVTTPVPAKIKKITTAASKQKASTSPVATASTPVAPVAAPVVEEVVPAAPSSWAQLAAGQASKWATGVVSLNKGTSVQSEEKPKVVAATTNNIRKNNTETTNTTPTTAPIARRTTEASKQPTKLPFVPEASLYVTGITHELKSDLLRSEFAALGALAHFDVKYNSGAAFVEYVDASIAKILLEEGGIVINGTRLTVEKRRVATRNSRGASAENINATKDEDAVAKKFTPTKSNRRDRPANKTAAPTPTVA